MPTAGVPCSRACRSTIFAVLDPTAAWMIDAPHASRGTPVRIANPAQHAESLVGAAATAVAGDAAPRPERSVALWNPELIDAELGIRASALGDASRLLAGFASRGLRTICFAKSRKAVEL